MKFSSFHIWFTIFSLSIATIASPVKVRADEINDDNMRVAESNESNTSDSNADIISSDDAQSENNNSDAVNNDEIQNEDRISEAISNNEIQNLDNFSEAISANEIKNEDANDTYCAYYYETENNNSVTNANSVPVNDYFVANMDYTDVDFMKIYLSRENTYNISYQIYQTNEYPLVFDLIDSNGFVVNHFSLTPHNYNYDSSSYYDWSNYFAIRESGYYYIKLYGFPSNFSSISYQIGVFHHDYNRCKPEVIYPKMGWEKDSYGYKYRDAHSIYAKNCWKYIVNGWYHFDANGYMESSKWIDSKFYLKSDGRMASNEWIYYNRKYYHFNSGGYMDTNKWIGNYYVKSNGVMATDAWVDGGNYYVDSTGKWIPSKWIKDKEGWWYRNPDGTYPKNCWKQIYGEWYHFNTRGYMDANKWIGDYYVKSNGVMATDEWIEQGKYYVGTNGKWIPNYR